MSIKCEKGRIVFREVAGMDEAGPLMEALEEVPDRRVDLSACTHMHAAVLQVLMAARPRVQAWPDDQDLRVWLRNVLGPGIGEAPR